MIRMILIALLSLALVVGFGTLSLARKGGSSGHSGSGGGHGSNHSDYDDSGHQGRHMSDSQHDLTFNGEGRHHHGNGLFGHHHGDGDDDHHHGEIEHGRQGVGEIEIHRSGGHD